MTMASSGCGAHARPAGAGVVRVLGGAGGGPGRFVHPRGVAVHAGRVFVVDKSGRLQALAPDGTPLAETRVVDGRVGFPIGVFADRQGVVLCDTHNGRVRLFDHDLAEGATIGAPGDGVGLFTYPQRATRAQDATGSLYVTEYGLGDANRVQVFGAGGAFLRAFGGYGLEGGRFARPMGIVVVGDEVFVADVSDRIVVFARDGRFLRAFGSSGHAAGELAYPYGLCAVGATLYVCEYGNNRLQRFGLDGTSGGVCDGSEILAGGFHAPWDVACDEQGLLYVCDTGNHRIVVLDPAEVPWRLDA
jgi:DNA-binding beta-propeller fold protein YncE